TCCSSKVRPGPGSCFSSTSTAPRSSSTTRRTSRAPTSCAISRRTARRTYARDNADRLLAVRRTQGGLPMNIHTPAPTAVPAGMSDAEWQARTDLAAVYRLVAHHGWDDVIYNHCSMRVPGEPTKFLMKQHELLWTEVTASNLVKVDMHADLDESAGV